MHLDGANAVSQKGNICGRGTVNGSSHAFLLVSHAFLLVPPVARLPRPDTTIIIEIVTGAADGEVIGRTAIGPVIVFPRGNPYAWAVDVANAALQSIRNPDQRLAIQRRIAEAMLKVLQAEK